MVMYKEYIVSSFYIKSYSILRKDTKWVFVYVFIIFMFFINI